MNADPEDAREDDDRVPAVKAMDWASRITSSSVMMILPALLGYWVDQKLGTIILFTFLGLVLGMTGAIWQLYHLVTSKEFQGGDRPGEKKEKKDQS